MLRVIDISVYQKNIDLSAVSFDAVIEKATGGNGYVNEDCDSKIQTAIALGRKWGFYHYYGDGYNDNNPISEADWFVDNCAGYFHQGLPILDWERGGNGQVNDTNAALKFLQHVESRTGVKPVIYMSLSLIRELDWSAVVAGGYGLWCAAYIDNNTPIPNWQMDPNRDPNPNWDGNVNDVLWQFTSTGRLDGYGGNLDCSFFYGNQAAWDAYAGVNAAPQPTTTTTSTRPESTTTTTLPQAQTPPDTATTTTTAPYNTTTTTNVQGTTTTTIYQTPQAPNKPLSFWQLLVEFLIKLLRRK